MLSTSTVQPVSGVELYGRPVSQWRAIAQNAVAALRANPRDAGARLTLQSAQGVLREHVASLARRNQDANARDMYSAAEAMDANKAGPGQTFAANALDAASLGLGDEIAGIGAMLPGGMTPQQARDRYRAGRAQLFADAPVSSLAGQVGGAVGLGTAAAKLPFLAGLGNTVVQGGRLGGPIARSVLAAATLGAGEGAIRGLASEGNLGQRVQNAGTDALVYGATAGAGTAGINTMRQGFGAVKAAKQILANRAAMSAIELERAAGMAPSQVANAANRATLSGARVSQLPIQQQILEDRALLAAFRTDAAVAERAGLGQVASGPATPATREAMLREWATNQGMAPDLIDGFVERAKRIPGSGLPRAEAPTAATVTTEAQAVGPAQRPGMALHDVQGNPIPGTEIPGPVQAPTMAHAPESAARAAHAQVMEATGDPLAARAAAAEAAGRARAAVPETPQAPALPRINPETMTRINPIVSGPPTPMAMKALLDEVGQLQPWERNAVTQALPMRWKRALGL